ncbi:MAG: hypothetical protein ACJAT2_003011 [Bacteriovoracaceae bacterium]|jgi:hypothetical protein
MAMGFSFYFNYTAAMKLTPYILVFSSLISFQANAKKEAVIAGYDNLALIGEEVSISVKAERAKIFPFRTDLKKQDIHYYLGTRFLGKAVTKKEGVAKLKHRFNKKGLYKIKSIISPTSKYKADATDNRILVADENSPILITDVDHTIADISGRDYLTTDDELIPELSGASKILNRLKSNFLILYVTARDDFFIKRSKFWLDYKAFPKGPTFFWDFGFWNDVPSNHGEYKEELIKKLKKKHKKILIGVGDKPHDMRAYRNNGLRAYYIGLPGFDLPKGTIKVKSWAQIEKHLKANPIGTLAFDPNP